MPRRVVEAGLPFGSVPWYRVRVHGDLDAAVAVLRGSEIVYRVEEAFAGFVEAGPPRLTVLYAIVEADTPTEAEGRVRDELSGHGDFDLDSSELPRSSKTG